MIFDWLIMPFGLTDASACFVDLLNRALRNHLNRFMLVLVDDAFIYPWMKKEHKARLMVILEVMRKHQLIVRFSKYHF